MYGACAAERHAAAELVPVQADHVAQCPRSGMSAGTSTFSLAVMFSVTMCGLAKGARS